jgi:hypothetical protein
MPGTPVDRVRQAVASHLGQLSGRQVEALEEAILIRSGLFCGRKFTHHDYQVIWFVEEDQVKFFSPSGDLLRVGSAADLAAAHVTAGNDALSESSTAATRRAA